MPPKLRQYLNRTILVSIPALFEDGKCRAYVLQAIEADGLWLNAPALAERLLPAHDRKLAEGKQLIFIPVAQIAAILLPPPVAPAGKTAVIAAATVAADAASTSAVATPVTRKPAKPRQNPLPAPRTQEKR